MNQAERESEGLIYGDGQYNLSDLRTTELHWWERGLPYSHAYCPLCSCNKNGYVDEPNMITEVCDSSQCPCHREDV